MPRIAAVVGMITGMLESLRGVIGPVKVGEDKVESNPGDTD